MPQPFARGGNDGMLQFLRFLVAGACVTGLSTAIYLCWTVIFQASPFLGAIEGHLIAVLLGYRLHSRWTFSEQCGARAMDADRRFFAASFIPVLLNGVWVWTVTSVLDGPPWLAAIPMIFITPWASFAANRHWVFRGSREADPVHIVEMKNAGTGFPAPASLRLSRRGGKKRKGNKFS
jgi:putative flippase GtrA